MTDRMNATAQVINAHRPTGPGARDLSEFYCMCGWIAPGAPYEPEPRPFVSTDYQWRAWAEHVAAKIGEGTEPE